MILCMPCDDRLGIIRDLTSILVERGISIVAIEMDKGSVYVECHSVSEAEKQQTIHDFQRVPGIHDVIVTSTMPYKERAEQLQAVLASVQDGILAVDGTGVLKQCNTVAARILQLTDESLECQLPKALADSLLINQTLRTGHSYYNREVFIENIDGYCVVNTRPLYNNARVVGVVAMLRDIRDVRALVQQVTGARPVTFTDISFISPAMERVIKQAKRYAVSDSTILIRGETGTGKELFARALHSASPRVKMMFVPVNCAAIPDTLLESELFGYDVGAFTGAAKGGKPGLFELANGGTLFLDEIGEISVHLQAKLLRVLQDKRVRRLGGRRELPVNVRIIAATHCDLEDMVRRQLFREDLYYRLNVIPLYLPPLRERHEDIPLLAAYFLRRFADRLSTPARSFSRQALAKLQQYSWPGNVRELENIVERAVNLTDGPEITPEHIYIGQQQVADTKPAVQFENYQTMRERLAEVEQNILQQTMERFRSARKAGAVLGLSHTAVLKKLRKYGLWSDGP